MSAYICDDRTFDYLVTWARNQRDLSAYVPEDMGPTDYDHVRDGRRFNLRALTPDQLGQILLDENVRSVCARYPNDAPDDLARPYHWSPVAHQLAPWVVSSCNCLRYQSCETEDYDQTLAYAVMQAIRESAIKHLTVDAPWGVTDDDITKHMAEIRAKMWKPGTYQPVEAR